jgi:hypothetical protein
VLLCLTDYVDPESGEGVTFRTFDNQRPFIIGLNGTIAVAWERRLRRNYPQVYYMEIREDGTRAVEPQRVAEGPMTCNYPQIAVFGSNRYSSVRQPGGRRPRNLCRTGRPAVAGERLSGIFRSSISGLRFPRGDLYGFWKTRREESSSSSRDDKRFRRNARGVNFTRRPAPQKDPYIVRWNETEIPRGSRFFTIPLTPILRENQEKRLRSLSSTPPGSSQRNGWMVVLPHLGHDYAGKLVQDRLHPGFLPRHNASREKYVFLSPNSKMGFLLSNPVRLRWDSAVRG